MVKQLYSARRIGRSFDSSFALMIECLLVQHHSYIYRHPINFSIPNNFYLISEISYTFVGSKHIKITLNFCVNFFTCIYMYMYIVARIYQRRGARRWRKVRRINGHAFVAKRLQVCILVVYVFNVCTCLCILLNRSRYVY